MPIDWCVDRAPLKFRVLIAVTAVEICNVYTLMTGMPTPCCRHGKELTQPLSSASSVIDCELLATRWSFQVSRTEEKLDTLQLSVLLVAAKSMRYILYWNK
eukprot:397655_1